MASVNSTVIARVAAGLYDLQLGNASMTWALNAVDSFTYGGEVSALVQQLYNTDFKAAGNAALAAVIVKNVGITNDPAAVTYVTNQLNAAAGNEGAAIVAMLNGLAGITSGPYAAAAAAFNTQIKAATLYAQGVGTVDSPVNPASLVAAKTFNLTAATAAGADVMRLTGGQDVRIDMTNPANQITGLDLDGDGTIEFDGKERSVTGKAANFEIVDAYARNPLNHTDIANNFLGDIDYNGTSFKGDGVSTNGNIVLGGLGTDKIFAGVGNDFLAGGGVAQGREGMDWLSGGRNADFFFAQFSPLDRTDGASSVRIDAGNTADDTSAAVKQSEQDNDWLLLEGTDDDETITVWLNDDNVPAVNTVEVQVGGGSSQTVTLPPDTDSTAVNVEVRNGDGIVDGMGRVLTRSGKSMLIDDVENLDASGNLYGFLNNMNVEIGGRATDSRDAAGNANYGIGSSAQLRVHGSEAGNIVIGGWDNDYVEGNGGSDLLMGGNLQQFLETVPGGVTNVNMAGIANDGRDELYGGEDSDNIVFEADGGVIDGGSGDDTLWLTKYSLGTMTASQMTKDGRLRFDLTSENGITEGSGNEGGAGYGGADDGSTADQTNYVAGESGKRVTVTNMESIDATGLGGIDYLASGANKPELKFTNQQNFKGYNGDLQLLGSQGDNGLYAGAGNDEIQGRGGDDDMMGGRGNDDFYFAIDGDFFIGGGGEDGDGVDVIRRKIDANGDDLWDTDADDEVVWGQDFGLDSDATIGESVLRVSIQKAGGNTAGTQLNQVVNNVSEIVTGVKVGSAFTAITLNTPAIKAATTYQGLTDAINAALDATPFGADLQATLQSDGFTIFIADAKGRELADAASEVPGAGVSVNQIANTATQNTFVFGAPAVNVVQDRLIYKSWEDRSDNEGVNDNSVFGSTMTLGEDAYAEDLVVSFQADGTRIAEDQQYRIEFDNLTTQDRVTVSVNGVQYQLQVGIDLDGNSIAGEQFVSTSNNSNQPTIQQNFLARLADFINNSFTDDDTVAGKVVANAGSDTLTLTQAAYDGEETVFMRTPVVTIENISGGQAATATVDNMSQHEVLLYKFDGRDNKLNETNVLFWGQESVQRANLETSKAAGGALAGLDAVIIDGGADDLAAEVANSTKAAIANNLTTNSPLSGLNYTVHGDDLLMGGAGVDQITGGTGDDRVIGSAGSATAPAIGATSGELADGGKNVYAVQVLGESKARVYVLNQWEARNPTLVADLAGLTISAITPIRDNEFGTGLSGGTSVTQLMFRDTLQFQQEDFGANARFTVALDDFTIATGGVVQTRNDGAGLVSVDADGNGVFESYTRFTNFENIRTVSGSGKAVAGSGQGNDTLDVTKLSSTTEGAGGVYYNLTNDGGAGEVRYSKDAIVTGTGLGSATGDRPAAGDYEELVIKVDGVENVTSSTGADLVRIDETEAAKNNTFSAGLGIDKIVYENNFGANGLGQPTVTIRVNTGADTDTVVMQGGRVGTLPTATGGAVDTLIGVEYLQIASQTATSVREDDVVDVTAMVAGAVVDYTNGEVRTSMTAGTGVQLVIENIVEMERVIADGNDVVIVADAAVMNTNDRSDEGVDGTSSKPILFMTYADFDQLVSSTSTARKSFAAQATDGQLTPVINQGQFSFSLSEVGTDADVDRVDYSNELGRIVVPVGQGVWTAPGALSNRAQYVVVDGDSDNTWSDAESRVDALWGVEEIVAARGQSIMDFTAVGQARQITFTYVAPSGGNPAENQVVEQAIRIADGNGNTVPGLNAFIERYTYNNTTTPVADATWNRIEGSDAAETVIYQGSEDLVNAAGLDHRFTTDVLTLRGGANEVRYSPLETSISASIGVVSEDTTTTGTAEGLITASITFQDGKGVGAPSGTFLGGAHTITSHTSDNSTAAGSLKIEGSQDAEDSITFTNVSPKTFILGASPGVITVNIGTTASMVLTGFEFLADTVSNDVYDIRAITSLAGLTLTDAQPDHDAIRVANDSVNYNGSGVNTIDLDNISATVGGLNFEFDVLDLTNLTGAVTGLTVNGGTNAAPVNADADASDEVVLGALSRVAVINDFESMVLTEASTAAGTSFTFNAALNTLTQGSTSITTTANILSFNGLVLEPAAGVGAAVYGKSYVPAATTGVNVTVAGSGSAQVHGGAGADTITGGPLADVIQGAAGNDTLSGGVGTEIRTVQLDLSMTPAAGGSVVATFDGFSSALTTITEGTEIAAGAGSNAVAAALAAKLQANLAAINAGATWSNGAQLVSVTANVNVLTFRFNAGADVLDAETITVAAAGDAGLTISSTSIAEQGSNGGIDTFLFEATGAANGNDTINNVTAGATGDVFDFTAFLGGVAVESLGGANFVTTGLDLSGAANLGIVFNKASLAAADIQTTAAAGKIAIENNGSAVVIVTADADGAADTTINNYLVYYVRDTDTGSGQTWSVVQVGTLTSSTEIGAADFTPVNFV